MPQTDPVADLLRRTPAPDAVRAQAWDAFQQATSEDDLATRLQAIQMPDTAKAALWDLKASETPQAAAVEPPAPVAAPKGGAWTGMNFGVPLVVDAAKGAFAGLMSTAVHGGDVIRRLTGMERIKDDPQVQNLITPPQNAAGKVGFYGEQIGEFLVPGGLVAKSVSKAPMVARMGAEAALGAGVAGVQSGADPTAMTLGTLGGAVAPPVGALARAGGRAVTRAAAGAKEGGVGGAIAAAVRTAAPSPPRTLIVQALKPRSTKVKFEGAVDLAMPELKAAEAAIGKPIQSVDDLLEATKAAKAQIQEQLGVMRGNTEGFQVNLSPVADAMERSIPRKLQIENPEAAARLKAAADVYRQQFSLNDAETILRETNAELDAFYAKYPRGQYAALATNPEAASTFAQAKALRDAIYARLDEPGGGAAARALQKRYGSLLEVEGEAYRRANVAKRQQPESLSEQIGTVRAAADMARGTWRILHGDLTGAADIAAAHAGRSTAKALKEAQTTDALIRRAFADFKGRPSAITMPARAPVAGYLGPGPIQAGPVPDQSFVRGVPAVPAQSERLALPPARVPEPPPIQLPGEVQPDPSFVRSVPAEYGAPWTPPTPPPAPPMAAPVARAVEPPVQVAPIPPPAVVSPTSFGTAGERLAQARRALETAKDTLHSTSKDVDRKPLRDAVDTAMQEWLDAKAVVQRVGPGGPSTLKPQEFSAPPKYVIQEPKPAPRPRQPKAAAPPKPEGQTLAQLGTVKPAPVTVKPVTKAKPATPAAAAAEVRAEIKHVIDTKGAKSAAEVQRRVMAALEGELSGAQQAAGFSDIVYERLGIKGGRVLVDGKQVASWQREFGGSKGRPVWTMDDAALKGVDLSNTEASVDQVSAALGRQRGAGRITVQIPGDGQFTIERNPTAIRAVLQRLKAGGTSPWAGLGDSKPAPKPTAAQVIDKAWKPTW